MLKRIHFLLVWLLIIFCSLIVCFPIIATSDGITYQDGVTGYQVGEVTGDLINRDFSLSTTNIQFKPMGLGYFDAPSESVIVSGLENVSDIVYFIMPGASFFETQILNSDSNGVIVRPKTGLTVGTYTGVLIVSNSTGNSKSVDLSFTVVGPSYSISLNPLEFEQTSEGYGTQQAKPLIITNTGFGTLNNIKVNFSSSNSNFEFTTTLPNIIYEGNSEMIYIRPKSGLRTGTYNETLMIFAADAPTQNVVLTFTVIPRTTEWDIDPVNNVTFPIFCTRNYCRPQKRRE